MATTSCSRLSCHRWHRSSSNAPCGSPRAFFVISSSVRTNEPDELRIGPVQTKWITRSFQEIPMSRGLNKVMVIGHLGRDPEMRYTPGGRPVTSFSVVTTRAWTSAEGERHEESEWFNVVAWGNLAEICN